MNTLLFKINSYLDAASRGVATMPPGLVEDFKEACGRALERQFNEKSQEYSMRMSGIGKPLCQQKLEQQGVQGTVDRTLVMRFLFGDLVEAAAIAIMKAAGVDVESEQEQCELDIGGITLQGTLDVEVDGKVWDVKSSSGYSFASKFGPEHGGFTKIEEEDAFGYIPQGFLYAESRGKPFGGWIAVDKSTGEFGVVETPNNATGKRATALKRVSDNIRDLRDNPGTVVKFEDTAEVKKTGKKPNVIETPTGNRLMPNLCTFCKFMRHCWPGAAFRPNATTKSDNPRPVWYTHYEMDHFGERV
tara:strand:- start:832 stop:1737 length:906 start_codon:yes stop_codon:yes gene_type:complete